MKPRRALDAHIEGVEAQNGALGVSVDPVVADWHHFNVGQDPGSGSALKRKVGTKSALT